MFKEFTPTEEQKKILAIEEGLHLVLAPPGSGKTELLAHRVFNAKKAGLTDLEIICLTFTNRAAKGMEERIEQRYPKNKILIGNIHRFSSKFLFQNNLIPQNTSVLDEEESDQLIEELKMEFDYPPIKTTPNGETIYDHNGKPEREPVYNPNLIKLATYLKQKELCFPEHLYLKPEASDIPDPWKAKELCEAYIKEKKENNYLDFDDLLTLTYYHLTKSKSKDLLLSKFKWLQVDEVQDLNSMQWAIVNEITAKDALVVYFGDYEQAIFSFMGAKLDFLHNIEKNVKSNSKNGIHNLLKNFRSPSYLLDIYIKYALAQWIPTWKTPPIPSIIQNAPEDALRIDRITGTIVSEAYFICNKYLPTLLSVNEKTAIIVKMNKSADIMSECLKRMNVPHFKISGFDIFRRKLVKGLMAFFSVFQYEYDRLSWARLFYEFKIIKTLKQSRTFVNELHSKGMTPIDILEYEGKYSRIADFFHIYLNQEMIVFDTETTGLETKKDDIIQIAAIKIVNGRIKDTFEVYIQTERDISESEKVHHISKNHLDKFGVSHEKGLMDFMQFCGPNAVFVAHNIVYDYAILQHNLSRFCNISLADYCIKQFDTIVITKQIYPNFPSYKLEYLINKLKVEGVNSHNALEDVKATVSLIEKLYFEYLKDVCDKQTTYLSNIKNITIFNEFITQFKPIYSLVQNKLNLDLTLNQASNYYYNYYKNLFLPKNENKRKEWENEWDNEMHELDKLLKHFDFYTNNEKTETLFEKIYQYIPEYKIFRESDLYLGTEKVVVSTVYKAKGLEFENVIVTECVENIYPHYYSSTEEAKLEDARAFYVAMTRSKKRLYFTSHTLTSLGYYRKQTRFLNCIKDSFENNKEEKIPASKKL